jgi:IS30 family transposase
MLGELKQKVLAGLREDWSPDQITGRLRAAATSQPRQSISHTTIYRLVHNDRKNGGTLYKHLRHGGKPYKKRGKTNAGVKHIPNRVDISERPAIVDEKARIGDFEGDTIISAGSKTALLTLVDKCSKFIIAQKFGKKTAQRTSKCMINTPLSKTKHTVFPDNTAHYKG